MSGERWLKLVGITTLIMICTIFLLSSAAVAEGEDPLLDELNDKQSPNGSWFNDTQITAKAMLANDIAIDTANRISRDAMAGTKLDNNAPYNEMFYYGNLESGVQWVDLTIEDGSELETVSFLIQIKNTGDGPDDFITMQDDWKLELRVSQEPAGSWNNDVGSTAMGVYAYRWDYEEYQDVVDNGADWLREQEDEDNSWGGIEDTSKAILALDSAGEDVWDELAALMLKQKPDGSFGGIEETSWAVMALSTNPNEESMIAMERAVTWLRAQDYENDDDLASAALAEQYYENAKIVEEEKGPGGQGFIPPPWMYLFSIFIIGALTLSYWLFARLDRNETLDGVRKDLYTYITDNPGEHLANITKAFELSSSSARYHLSVLEGMDKIVSHKNGKYKRYYVNQNGYSKYTNGCGYKHIMSALKNATARKIVKFLISNPESNQKRVSNALELHPSTVNWHAERLRDAEIISKRKKGKEIVYSLNSEVQLNKVIGIIEGSPA
jgi:predicted transcriptional regulator